MKKSLSQAINEMVHHQDHNEGISSKIAIDEDKCRCVLSKLCKITEIRPLLLKSQKRDDNLIYVRVAYYLISMVLCPNLSTVTIATIINRTHSSISQARVKYAQAPKYDPNYYECITGIIRYYEAETGSEIIKNIKAPQFKPE